MTILRLFGVLIGGLIFLYEFNELRTGKRRFNPWLLFVGSALIALSLFPTLVNLPAEMFSLESFPGGRLITLLVGCVAILFPLALGVRNKANFLEQLVLNMGIKEAVGTYESPEAVPAGAIWVVIPVLDEEDNLREFLGQIPKDIDGIPVNTLIVDDGSTDSSREVAKEYQCSTATLPINYGGGLALKAGFRIAAMHDARLVVTMDGDNQHNPQDITALVAPILEGDADLVIGSRHLGSYERISMMRSIGIYSFNIIINILQGTSITDCSSGFRSIRLEMLEQVNLKQPQYHTAEMIISVAKSGGRIVEVPIAVKSRTHGSSKKGRDLLYGFKFLQTVLRTWLGW
nr:glycosyltransferase family 2 protein [uncultured Pseudodesulfovibrio sp.]